MGLKRTVSMIVMCTVCFLLANSPASAEEPVYLDSSDSYIELDDVIEVLEDKTGEWSIDDILSDETSEKFEYNRGSSPSFGYTESVYWVRVQINPGDTDRQWYLKLDNPTMDDIVFFMTGEDDGTVKVSETGDLYPFHQREVDNRNFIFPLEFNSHHNHDIYLRLQTEGAMQIPLAIMDQEALVSFTQNDYLIFGLFAGVALVMAFYNLFVFLSLRHKSYLYYVFFIIVNLFTLLAFSGLAYQFIWPDAVWWNNRSIVFLMGVSNIFGLLFAKSFLEPENMVPRSVRWFNRVIVINLLILVILMYSYPLALDLIVIATILSVAVMITVAFLVLRKGFRPARFFFIAWHIFVIGVVVSILTDVGLLPFTFVTKYAWQITMAAELILLSFALADKINLMRQEKETAEQEALDSQREALENLKKSDKLKDEFLATTSHELRTPLNGIIGLAESLNSGAAGDMSDPVKNHLSMIILSGRRLSHLIDDIIDFSKLKNNDMDLLLQRVDVKEVTDMVVTICATLIKEKPVKLVSRVSPEIPDARADENRLQQILYNIIGNAIKYTDEGTVTLEVKEEDGSIKFIVSDTGIGIPAGELESVFLPFHKGDYESDRGEGMGIGLNISRRLVELQGGEVAISSEEGSGTVLTFTLPVYGTRNRKAVFSSREAAPIVKIADTPLAFQETVPAGEGNKQRILVADDEPVNLQILINYLWMAGYEVKTARNGEEALKLLQGKEMFDLVILDIMMPKMSGYKVCRHIRENYSLHELPVLMLTAQNQLEDRLSAFEAGANDYLVKPVDKRELLARTKTFIYVSQAVREAKSHAEELAGMNVKLRELNDRLEDKVQQRTKELEGKNVELHNKNNELISLEKSRLELLSNISHELGTPITFLQSYVQTVREGFIEATDPKYLELVRSKVALLDHLINDLFDLVKFETGKMSMSIENVDLQWWIGHIHGMFVFEVENKKISFPSPEIKNLDNHKGVLSIDLGRMEQVFSNLIYNALKHTGERGRITLKAEVRPYTQKKMDLPFDGEVIIEVSDNGAGIEKKQLPHIFERFFKGAAGEGGRGGGTGLGLAITKEIIDYHKGGIWVESKIGTGTSFYFSLPLILKKADEQVKNAGSERNAK